MDTAYTFKELRDIIRKLRAPDGCPWDLAQTHESLIPCLKEESAEVIEGIQILKDTQDGDNLCEELGDVLLQVMLHSQIAEEEGLFTVDDVIEGLCRKMIRRHPHVFGDKKAGSPAEAGRNQKNRKSRKNLTK
jgi:tetrapyrrole methylase family protein / MazG family protein